MKSMLSICALKIRKGEKLFVQDMASKVIRRFVATTDGMSFSNCSSQFERNSKVIIFGPNSPSPSRRVVLRNALHCSCHSLKILSLLFFFLADIML